MRLPFSPEQASSLAPEVDNLYLYLVALTFFFTSLIFILIVIFSVKYRRRHEDEEPAPNHLSVWLEISWSVIPFIIAMTIFFWGTVLFFKQFSPPANADEIFVVGKQWMWKIQHPEGRREINELHLPVGRAVRLKMTSEDVIHSFYIPAFRAKMDVVPGRYTEQWFLPTKAGRYHLFCAEYCGTNHSRMTGWVTVMEPEDYEKWLENKQASDLPVETSGAQLFKKHRCDTCHTPSPTALGPRLAYGTHVTLADGRKVLADEKFLRESIVLPAAKITAGYSPIMPTYQGQISEEEIMQIIQYIKTMDPNAAETPPSVPAAVIKLGNDTVDSAQTQQPGMDAGPGIVEAASDGTSLSQQ